MRHPILGSHFIYLTFLELINLGFPNEAETHLEIPYTSIDYGDVANWYEKNKTLFEKK